MDLKIAKFDFQAYWRGLGRRDRIRLSLFAVCLVVFIPFVVWPAWILRPYHQIQMKELSARVNSAKAQIQQEPKLLAEQIAYDSLIKETQARLFTEKEIQGLLGVLADLAQKSKVVLLSSQPQTTASEEIPAPYGKKYHSLSYLLALEGGYHALSTFVSEVENHPKLIRVDDFSVTPREETPGVHVAELRLSVFQKREGT